MLCLGLTCGTHFFRVNLGDTYFVSNVTNVCLGLTLLCLQQISPLSSIIILTTTMTAILVTVGGVVSVIFVGVNGVDDVSLGGVCGGVHVSGGGSDKRRM